LITLLQSAESLTAEEMARELNVSKRTIFRDLNVLESANVPYYYDGDRGGYTIHGHFFLPPVNLTLGEALAVLLLAGPLRRTREMPLMANASRAAMKLESILPSGVRRHVGSALRHFRVSPPPRAQHRGLEDMFDTLARAVADHNVCRIAYVSFHEQKHLALDVHPLRLVFMSRAWYVVAWSAEHGQVRTFKLGRIAKLTVTGETFEPPPDFDLDKHFGQAWSMIPEGQLHDVHLRFERKVAGNVAEVQWHPSQRVHFNDDGSADVWFRVDGLGEITWWILGYGNQVEVIAPPALRRRMADIAAGVLARHAEGGAHE